MLLTEQSKVNKKGTKLSSKLTMSSVLQLAVPVPPGRAQGVRLHEGPGRTGLSRACGGGSQPPRGAHVHGPWRASFSGKSPALNQPHDSGGRPELPHRAHVHGPRRAPF